MQAHALVIAVQTCVIVEVKEVGAERLTNFNERFRKSKIPIKITQMTQRISR